VQLRHRRVAFDQRADDRDLAFQVAHVARRAAAVARDDLVARAVVADRVAERQVHVERQRLRGPRLVARLQRGDVLRRAESFMEAVGRGYEV
jgi:hypothetical protein